MGRNIRVVTLCVGRNILVVTLCVGRNVLVVTLCVGRNILVVTLCVGRNILVVTLCVGRNVLTMFLFFCRLICSSIFCLSFLQQRPSAHPVLYLLSLLNTTKIENELFCPLSLRPMQILIFQNMNCVRSNGLSLKYQRFKPSD